jgi:S1-C subfamily serine protease
MAGVDPKHRFLVQARRGDDLKFFLIKPRPSAPGNDVPDAPDAASQVKPTGDDRAQSAPARARRARGRHPLHAEGDPFLRRTTTVRVVERSGPAVVNVTTEQRAPESNPFRPFAGDPIFDRFFQDFFEPRGPRTEQSLGSAC